MSQTISGQRGRRWAGQGPHERGDSLKGDTHFVLRLRPAPAVKPDRHHHVARAEDGRLFYDNQWYCRGQAICVNKKDEYPARWVPGDCFHSLVCLREDWLRRACAPNVTNKVAFESSVAARGR